MERNDSKLLLGLKVLQRAMKVQKMTIKNEKEFCYCTLTSSHPIFTLDVSTLRKGSIPQFPIQNRECVIHKMCLINLLSNHIWEFPIQTKCVPSTLPLRSLPQPASSSSVVRAVMLPTKDSSWSTVAMGLCTASSSE